jgi:four helix bundle protein
MADYRDLEVWKKARALTRALVKALKGRTDPEYADLRRQMKRACISIRANISEGSGKWSDKEFVRFLRIAVGSCNELEDHCATASDVEYLPEALAANLQKDISEIRKMLYGLIKYLEGRND